MSGILDLKVNPKVVTALNKYGRDLVLRVYPSEVVDPVTSTTTPGTPTDHTVKGSPPVSYEAQYIDGESIKVGDAYVVILPSDVNGQDLSSITIPGLEVRIDSKVWRTVSVETFIPNVDVAAYLLQLR